MGRGRANQRIESMTGSEAGSSEWRMQPVVMVKTVWRMKVPSGMKVEMGRGWEGVGGVYQVPRGVKRRRRAWRRVRVMEMRLSARRTRRILMGEGQVGVEGLRKRMSIGKAFFGS